MVIVQDSNTQATEGIMQKPRAPKQITSVRYENYVTSVALLIAEREGNPNLRWEVECAGEDALACMYDLTGHDETAFTQKEWHLTIALFEGQVDGKYSSSL